MKNILIGRLEIKKIILLILALIISAFLIFALNIELEQASRKCLFDRWFANLNSREPLPLQKFFPDSNIFPQRLAYATSDTPLPEYYLSTLAPLDFDVNNYSIISQEDSKLISIQVYWFGTSEYAECKFTRMISWDLIHIPEIWLNKTENLMPGRDIYGTDAVNCFGATVYQDPTDCTWVSLYNEYVFSFSASTGEAALTYEEFDQIIFQLDKNIEQIIKDE